MEELLMQIAAGFLPALLTKMSASPIAVAAITEVVGALKQTTAKTTVTVPVAPVGGMVGTSAVVTRGPSEFVRYGQHLINQYLKPTVSLVEDGWLGKKTQATIAAALAPYGIVIPVDA